MQSWVSRAWERSCLGRALLRLMAVDNKAVVVCLWIAWSGGLARRNRANDAGREHAGVHTTSSHSERLLLVLRLSASQRFHDAPKYPLRSAAVF
jgi:hypothetical protein